MNRPALPPVSLSPDTPPTDEQETALAQRWGEPRLIERQIPVAPGLTEKTVRDFFSDRWGEVVMVIRRSVDGLVWVMTKESFPSHKNSDKDSNENPCQNSRRLYSLPTGGIRHNEPIETALWRELEEETGFEAQLKRFLAVIRYVPILASEDPQDLRREIRGFVSYIFLLQEDTGDRPVLNCGEKILDFKTVSPAELLTIARQWRSLSGSSDQFHDLVAWGMFRSLTHQTVGQILMEN